MKNKGPYAFVDLGEKLKRARKHRKLRQKEIAEKLNVDPTTVNKWERGTRRPSTGQLAEIGNELKVGIAYFHTPSITLQQAIRQYELDSQASLAINWKGEMAGDSSGESSIGIERTLDLQPVQEKEKVSVLLWKVAQRPPILQLLEAVMDWSDASLEVLLAWVAGYEQGRRKEDKGEG